MDAEFQEAECPNPNSCNHTNIPLKSLFPALKLPNQKDSVILSHENPLAHFAWVWAVHRLNEGGWQTFQLKRAELL